MKESGNDALLHVRAGGVGQNVIVLFFEHLNRQSGRQRFTVGTGDDDHVVVTAQGLPEFLDRAVW